MKKRILAILLVLVLVVPVFAEEYTETQTYTDLKEGDTVSFSFEHDVSSWDLDGFELIGQSGGIYEFRAIRDMDTASITAYYSVKRGEDEQLEEEGESNSNGRPSEEVGGEIEWGGFELGKHDWDIADGEKQYAIRIDVEKYKDNEYIILQDLPSENLNLKGDITVNKLSPDDRNVVQNTGTIDYEFIDKGTGLTIKIPITDEAAAYDIVYFMTHDGQPVSNSYKVYTVKEWEEIIAGGSGSGSTTDKPKEDEEEPEIEPEDPIITPEEPEEEPIIEEGKPNEPIEEPKETPEEEEEAPVEPINPPVEEEEEHYDDPEVDEDREKEDKEEPKEEESNPVIPTLPEDNEVEEQPKTEEEIPEKEPLEEEDIEIEEGIVEVEEEDTPEGSQEDTKDEPKEDVLPKTGEDNKNKFALGGLFMLSIGIILIPYGEDSERRD